MRHRKKWIAQTITASG